MIQNAAADSEVRERRTVLKELEQWLETPMVVLSAVWFTLVLVELVWGQALLFEIFGALIWLVFIGEFALRLWIAPDRRAFVRGNVLTMLALAVPALRVFRVLGMFRILSAVRGLRLLQIVATANNSMNALRRSLGRRGLGYILLLTLAVMLLGAAGMMVFEPASEVANGFASYGAALWWTAMLLTTMGSGFWPVTGEGRVLALLLSLYGIVIFGYITASFATFFIGQEARDQEGEVAGASDIAALRDEIAALRAELRRSSSP